MRRICTYILLVCLGFGADISAATISDFVVPRNFRFEKDLKLGTSTTPDVYYLQNLLNMSTSTRIAQTGTGSNKALTTYYGDKTRDAVGRFQTIFAADIAYEKSLAASSSLASSTLASSTLISSSTVDVFTRAVLNKLIIIYSDDRDLYIKSLTGTLPAESAAVEEAPAEEPEEAPAEEPAKQTTTNTSNSNNNSNSSSNSSKPEGQIYKNQKTIFTYSPQGQLLKAIGGNALVDKVFSYTPAGQIGKLTGADGGSNGNAGKAAGVGAGAIGISSLLGGGGAAAGGAAASAAKPLPFGGVSTAMVTCTCSGNLLIYVQDVRGPVLPLIYQPGATMLYMQYQPRSGVNMLGQYVPGGVCTIYVGTACSTGGTPIGTMIQLGTSMTIAPGK